MIKPKPKKRVLKRKNPEFISELELLLGKQVTVYSRFATITGKLKGGTEFYYVEVTNATMGFKPESIKDILNKSIYLKDAGNK